MILGEVRDRLPRVALTLTGTSGPVVVEFIVDTAFDGEMKLPPDLVRQLDTEDMGREVRMLANGSLVECSICQITLGWNDEERIVEVLVLEGRPLLGTVLLEGWHLDIDLTAGGQVVLEPPV